MSPCALVHMQHNQPHQQQQHQNKYQVALNMVPAPHAPTPANGNGNYRGAGGGGGGGGGGNSGSDELGRGLHSSICSALRKHFLWDTLRIVSLSVTKTAQVELKCGRV